MAENLEKNLLNSYFRFRSACLNGDTSTTSASSSNYKKLNRRYQELKFVNKTNIEEYLPNQR